MSDLSTEEYQKITKKAAQSMGWNYLSFGASKALNLVTISILAHMLVPESFGLVALAALSMDYLSVISDLGLGAALIQRKTNLEESASTAFTLNLLANAVLTLVLFSIAPLVAAFFHEPKVASILGWLSFTFVLSSVGSVHNVLLQRELNFKKKLIPDLGASIVKAIVSIGLAVAGFGVWALVVGQLVGAAITTVLLWYVIPWRPKLAWNWKIGKELFKYGISITGTNALSAWQDNFDYVVIGKFYSATGLGIYSIAYRLPETLVITTLWIMTSVLFPTFSAMQDQKEALKKSFLSTVRYVELLVTPICLGMIIAAGPIIRVAFGEQWTAAIPILRILALYAWVMSIGFHAGDVYKAVGRPDILVKVAVPTFIVRVIALWIGAQYSLLGVAIAHLIVESLSAVVRMIIMWRMLQVSAFEILRELKALMGAAGLALLAVPAVYLTAGLPPMLSLLITVLAGGAGYLGIILLIEGKALKGALRTMGVLRAGTD